MSPFLLHGLVNGNRSLNCGRVGSIKGFFHWSRDRRIFMLLLCLSVYRKQTSGAGDRWFAFSPAGSDFIGSCDDTGLVKITSFPVVLGAGGSLVSSGSFNLPGATTGLFHHGIRRHRYFSPQAGGSTTELSATIKSEYASLSLSRVSSSRWPYCSYSEAVTVSGSEWALICSATELASTARGIQSRRREIKRCLWGRNRFV